MRFYRKLKICFVWGTTVFQLSACSQPLPETYMQHLGTRDPRELREISIKLLRLDSDIVPALLADVNSENWRVRFMVVQLLGKLKDQRAVPVLLHAAGDSNHQVAEQAVSALGEMRVSTAVPVLSRTLGHKKIEVAQAAARALGKIRSLRALAPLLQYANDISTTMRAEVIQALGACHSYEREPALSDSAFRSVLKALRDAKPEVRIAALVSLREFGYMDSAEELLSLLRDPSLKVQHVAVQALGEVASGAFIGAAAEISPALRSEMISALISVVDSVSYQTIRTKTIRALGSCRTRRAIAPLKLLKAEGTEEDRREASRALEQIEPFRNPL